jgi:hypothetical protein
MLDISLLTELRSQNPHWGYKHAAPTGLIRRPLLSGRAVRRLHVSASTPRNALIIRTIGGGLVPEALDDSAVRDQKHARHLERIADRTSYSVTAEDSRLKSPPPEFRCKKLSDADTLKTERPIETALRITDARDIAQTVIREELCGLLFARHVNER